MVGSLITIKPTASDTLIIEPYYGNEGNASTDPGNTSNNARWNAILAYYTHDFNDQTQPNAFSLRVRGELFEDAGGARTCGAGANNFTGGGNACALSGSGILPLSPGGHPLGSAQTLWGGTFTLQWKPAPSLITRTEFRYDKSDKNVFLNGQLPVNNQQTLAFSVVYLF